MKNSILVISDSEEQNYTAISQAAELAKAYQCNLHIVNFCYQDLLGFDNAETIKNNIIDLFKYFPVFIIFISFA